MSHRPGHIDNGNSPYYSMDRRKYLKTLAIGSVGAGLFLEACNSENKEQQDDHDTEKKPSVMMWGVMSLYAPDVVSIKAARDAKLPETAELIKVPFYNTNQIDIKEGEVVGFHLMQIGDPVISVIAVNLVKEDEDPHHAVDTPTSSLPPEERNRKMDACLTELGLRGKQGIVCGKG